MKTLCLSVACFAAVLTTFVIDAQELKKMEVEYRLGSKSIIDPPPNEKKDRAFFYFSGSDAKKIYNSMQVPAKKSMCGEDITVKTAGGLECNKYTTGEYSCSVGILLSTGHTAKASVC